MGEEIERWHEKRMEKENSWKALHEGHVEKKGVCQDDTILEHHNKSLNILYYY